jgi:hypothetical protein
VHPRPPTITPLGATGYTPLSVFAYGAAKGLFVPSSENSSGKQNHPQIAQLTSP